VVKNDMTESIVKKLEAAYHQIWEDIETADLLVDIAYKMQSELYTKIWGNIFNFVVGDISQKNNGHSDSGLAGQLNW